MKSPTEVRRLEAPWVFSIHLFSSNHPFTEYDDHDADDFVDQANNSDHLLVNASTSHTWTCSTEGRPHQHPCDQVFLFFITLMTQSGVVLVLVVVMLVLVDGQYFWMRRGNSNSSETGDWTSATMGSSLDSTKQTVFKGWQRAHN